MSSTNKQKNCPYCHDEKLILAVDDEIQVYVDNSIVYKGLTLTYDFEKEATTDEEFVDSPFGATRKKINYCPMCGRQLNEEADND